MTMTDANAAMVAAARRARSWLLDDAAPLWASRGRTDCGLFAERMTLDGQPDASYFRSFVQARHIFSFVTAGQLGWDGPWASLVDETVDILLAGARRADGFFVHSLTENGKALDERADLYDQAFILFALGVGGGALGRQDLFDAAEHLLDTIENNWAHPQGGFTEGEIVDATVRRQNPHMHLFEAFSALAEQSGRQRFADASITIATLARDRFIDPATGALREYFTEDWQPAGEGRHSDGNVIEPGHCSEWAWLFERLAANGWVDGLELSNGLVGFARSHGIDASRGVMVDEVWIDGTAKSLRARCWPQTERAKAAAARWNRLQSDAEAEEAVAAMRGLDTYLAGEKPGLWRDKLNEDGSWVEEMAPGSSLYHISCAVAELAAVAR